MLQLFRNNTPYTVLLLFILALLAKMQALGSHAMPAISDGKVFYTILLRFLTGYASIGALGLMVLATLLIFLQSLYLHSIAIRHRLFQKPTYLPSYCYIVFTSLHPAFTSFSAAMLTNWAVLVGLDIILSFNQSSQPRKNIFNAGFALAFAALIEVPALGFILFLITSLLLLRTFNAGEWVVAFLGYLSPIYFSAGLLFLIDNLPLLYKLPRPIFTLPASITHPVNTIGMISGIVILLAIGLFAVRAQLNKSTMNIRRSWVNTICLLVITFLISLPTSGDQSQWMLIMLPLSLIVAYAFQMEKKARFSNFTFYFSLVLLIFSQLTINR